ncbi:hypothetical protein BVG79_01139 [Ketogulonicigenium robustum]|uniref:Acyltransferase 3 domain-containing protein n=2 Tax=Ketogulonicigenium robustum TaxID=92947 RepID=A0A1W6NZ11_9RHOB|nr:hypothetical protein BVG79_01139 [Ketogulonicigenium robustum]
MVLSHLVFPQGFWLLSLHFRSVMFTESAQAFVFVSGLVFGLVGQRRLSQRGYPFLQGMAKQRIWQLWRYCLGLLAVIFLMRLALPDGGDIFKNWTGTAEPWDPWRTIALLGLVYQPTFADILPMYILFIAASVPALRLVDQGRWKTVMAASALLWLSVQLKVWVYPEVALDWIFGASDGQGLRMAFHPFGWQLLFMGGLVIGAQLSRGALNVAAIPPQRAAFWAAIATGVLLLMLPLRVLSANVPMPEAFYHVFRVIENRRALGPLFVISFAAVGYLVAWLLVYGRYSRLPVVGHVGRGLAQMMQWRPAVMMGQHSLQTYVWHVPLVYLAFYFSQQLGPLGQVGMTVTAVVVYALLPLPALWRSHQLAPNSQKKSA